jgi:hypothetical protein
MFSGLKDKAAAVAGDAQKLATSGPTDIKERASSMAAAATDKAKDNAVKLKEQVKEKANETVDKAKDGAKEFAKQIVHGALDKVSKKIGGAMGSDPDMPKPVKAGLQDIVDALMVEVKADIDATIDGMAAGDSADVNDKILEGPAGVCKPNPCSWFRACVLYTMFPHDKSIWAKLKTPSWWLIMILANMPIYGVAQAYFLLLFILMDKGDIFQLVNFIQTLKVASVVSIGFIPAVTGGIMVYLDCIPKGTCSIEGPGMQNSSEFLISTAFWGVQMLLTWIAALCLPCAKTKGMRSNTSAAITKRQETGKDRFAMWIVYDLIVAVAMGGWIYTHIGDPLFITYVFWGKTFYGYLCLPWFLLKLPLMGPMILKTKMTAYNPQGKTVPMANGKEKKINRERRLANKHPSTVMPV